MHLRQSASAHLARTLVEPAAAAAAAAVVAAAAAAAAAAAEAAAVLPVTHGVALRSR
jgi:hypothetical protein